MAEFKIVKFTPESSEEITKLIQSVNLLAEPFFISDGYFGIMFKSKDETGIDKTGFVNEVSKEIVKAQKKYIQQEVLVRAYTKTVENLTKLGEEYKFGTDEATKALEEHQQNKDAFISPETEKRHSEITSRLGQLKDGFKKQSREKKDEILKEVNTLEAELKPLVAEMEDGAKKFDAETTRLKLVASEVAVKMVNNSGELKEQKELKESAVKELEHALLFITVGTNTIADINNGTLDQKTNILTFKEA